MESGSLSPSLVVPPRACYSAFLCLSFPICNLGHPLSPHQWSPSPSARLWDPSSVGFTPSCETLRTFVDPRPGNQLLPNWIWQTCWDVTSEIRSPRPGTNPIPGALTAAEKTTLCGPRERPRGKDPKLPAATGVSSGGDPRVWPWRHPQPGHPAQLDSDS